MLSPIWIARYWHWLAFPAARAAVLGLTLGVWLRFKRWPAATVSGWWRGLLYAALLMPLLSLMPGYQLRLPGRFFAARAATSPTSRDAQTLAEAEPNLPASLSASSPVNSSASSPAASQSFKPAAWVRGTDNFANRRQPRQAREITPGDFPRMAATPYKGAEFPEIAARAYAAREQASFPSVVAARHAGGDEARANAGRSGALMKAEQIWLALYLTIAGLLAARWLAAWLLTRKLVRAGRPVCMPTLPRLLERECARLGLRRRPELRLSATAMAPLTAGWRKPVILLPEDSAGWSEARLGMVLAHELAHVSRRDYFHRLLSALHICIFWFNPLSWWLDRRLHEAAEQAADDAAVASGASAAAYAEMLLDFVARLSRGWQPLALGGLHAPLAQPHRMARRLERLFDPPPRPAGRGAKLWSWALAAPLLYGLAGLHLAAARPKPTGISQPQARQAARASQRTQASQPVRAMQTAQVTQAVPTPAPQGGVRQAAHQATASSGKRSLHQKRQPAPTPRRRIESYYLHAGHLTASAGESAPGEGLTGNYLWFRSGGKSYVIRDPKVLAAAAQIMSRASQYMAREMPLLHLNLSTELAAGSMRVMQRQMQMLQLRMQRQQMLGQRELAQAMTQLQAAKLQMPSLARLQGESELIRRQVEQQLKGFHAINTPQWRAEMRRAERQAQADMEQARRQLQVEQQALAKSSHILQRKWQQRLAQQQAQWQAGFRRLQKRNWARARARMARQQAKIRQRLARLRAKQRRAMEQSQKQLRQLLRRALHSGIAKPQN